MVSDLVTDVSLRLCAMSAWLVIWGQLSETSVDNECLSCEQLTTDIRDCLL